MPSIFNRRRATRGATHGPGSIGCTRTLMKLQRYLDGEIDEAVAAKILRHIEVCERCGLRAEAYTALKNSLAVRRVADSDEVSPMVDRLRGFADGLMSRDGGP